MRTPKTGVCFTFHVGAAVQTSGLLSDGDIYFIDGFDNIKKLQFRIHADKFMKTATQHSKKGKPC